MGADPRARALPNPRTALVLGIFNVNFSILLMLCVMVSAASLAVTPTITRAMSKLQTDLKDQVEKKRTEQLASLDAEEKAATTEKEKQEIAARRKEIEEKPVVPVTPMMDLSDMGMDNPTLIAWSWAELISGLVVNLMLLASGIGLLHCKTWSWRLGFWTAILKITRLVVLYSICIGVVIPAFTQKMGNAVAKMMSAQQAMAGRPTGGMPPAEMFVKIYSVMYSGMAVGMIILGSIYPLIVIWTLTRQGVRAACFPYQLSKPKPEPLDS